MKPGGFTLVELLVALVILSTLLAVSAFSLVGHPSTAPSVAARALERARTEALHSGRPVAVALPAGPVLFLPDGSARGPGVDPLTGISHEALR